MSNRQLPALILCSTGLLLFAATVIANPVWNGTGPTPGPGAGTITVAGTIALPPGSQTTGTAVAVVWPVAGGTPVEAPVAIPSAGGVVGWGPSQVTGLNSSVPYFVIVKIEVSTGTTIATHITDPKTITAP